ncbi:MAG TPA: 16S rRNA (adenine(1518)-N(6)/adenine(1519)-N(6))-dimethyltransferase RsmA [Candidatus Moranbacteria bacterium]|nr:16S rRNA (adenine(1518)-N(6)/adenine(1519)-N(6))-dimethyltransferase RsmA [Candidatus Moranbacteria bacterium]
MQPKKSLGQNFLRDKNVLEKIIASADLKSDDFVIEIGPGEGVLTEELAKHAGKVLAVEIDKTLADKLKEKYKNNKKIEILNDDILKINLPEILRHSERSEAKSKNLLDNITSNNNRKILRLRPSTDFAQDDDINYKLIANIPYYITSPIIQLFLETKYPPSVMILMVQKEVAQRICANPGQMSILAVSVQYYSKPELLFYVDKKSFYPVPEVDSAVIKISGIRNYESGIMNQEETKKFFRIVKAGFSAKRKMLLNNLSSSLHLEKKQVEEKLKKVGISPASRAQELSMEDWKNIATLIYE